MCNRRLDSLLFLLLHHVTVSAIAMAFLVTHHYLTRSRKRRRENRRRQRCYSMTLRRNAQCTHLRRITQIDGSARGLRFRPWPYFNDWIEIFGQDRATGEFVETFTDLLNETTSTPLSNFGQAMDLGRDSACKDAEYAGESTSVSQPEAGSNTKTRKRKSLHEDDLSIVTAFNNFAESTRATMVEFMAALGKQTRGITDLNAVLEALDQVPGLTVTERVEVAEILAENPTKSELFFKLTGESRICYVRRLLNTSR